MFAFRNRRVSVPLNRVSVPLNRVRVPPERVCLPPSFHAPTADWVPSLPIALYLYLPSFYQELPFRFDGRPNYGTIAVVTAEQYEGMELSSRVDDR